MAETTTKATLPQVLPAGGQVIAVVPQSVEEIFRLAKGIVQSGLAPSALTGYLKKDTTDEQMTKAVSAVAIVIMAGAELGLPPMVSLRSFTAINGRPALYGDGLINVVRRSGRAKHMQVGYTRGNDWRLFVRAGLLPKPEPKNAEDLKRVIAVFEAMPIEERTGGYCDAARADTGEDKVSIFTIAQAKRASLWQTETEVIKEVWEEGADGRRRPVKKKVPNDSPWYRYPERMLGWRAAGFCLRELFGDVLGGITDDWEAREIGGMVDVTPTSRPAAPTPPEPPEPPEPKGTIISSTSTEAAKDIAEPGPSEVASPAADFVPEGEITPEVQRSLDQIKASLAACNSEEDVESTFDGFDVQAGFAGNTLAIGKAFGLKDARLAEIANDGQGALFGDDERAP